jgi:hypothetical protein
MSPLVTADVPENPNIHQHCCDKPQKLPQQTPFIDEVKTFNRKIFMSNVPPISEKGSQLWPTCSSNKKCYWMKISTEHWRNYTDKGKPKQSQENLYQCHVVRNKSNMD